ncbi:MAG TPA: hypothetical protein VIL65_10035 [Beijerinckiaceae bacterium]
MHGTLPDLHAPDRRAVPDPDRSQVAAWLLRGVVAIFGLGLGFLIGLIVALSTGLTQLC